MLDMNDDGTIGIDFDTDGGVKRVTLKRPKFGAYRRLKAEANSIVREAAKARQDLIARTTADEDISPEEADAIVAENEDRVIDWWRLVLHGDDTFKALTADAVPEIDDWPPYLVFG